MEYHNNDFVKFDFLNSTIYGYIVADFKNGFFNARVCGKDKIYYVGAHEMKSPLVKEFRFRATKHMMGLLIKLNIIQKQGMYNMLRNMDVNELRQKLIQFSLSNSNDPDVQIAYEIIKKFLNNEK